MPVHTHHQQIPYGVPPPAPVVHQAPTDAAPEAPTMPQATPAMVATSTSGASTAAPDSSVVTETPDVKPAPASEDDVEVTSSSQIESGAADTVATLADSTDDVPTSSVEPAPAESGAQETVEETVTEEEEMPSDNKPGAQKDEVSKDDVEPESKPVEDIESEVSLAAETAPPAVSKDSTPEPEKVSHDTVDQEPVPETTKSTAISQLPAEGAPTEVASVSVDENSAEKVKEPKKSVSRESSPAVSETTTPPTREVVEDEEAESKPENGILESSSDDNGK